MMKKNKLKIIIALVIGLVLLVLFATSTRAELLTKITKDIIENITHASHGDDRDIDKMTVKFIKENTGSSDRVDEAILPKALRPIKKYAHPPFTMGACQVCHAPNKSKPAAILTKKVSELCFWCHPPKLPLTMKQPSKEQFALDCNKCHSPHHSDKKKFIRPKVRVKKCPVGEFKD